MPDVPAEEGTRRGGALAGVLVLDLTRFLAGPYMTQILADLGATVVKIENPSALDESRQFPPLLAGDGDELSAYFAQYNRGKMAISIDLSLPAGREVFLKLVERADVVVENFRPGTTKKLGIDYDAVRARNPRIVYTAISGYGHTSPMATRPAFDNTAQAAGGILSMNGSVESGPVRVGVAIGDVSATLFAAIGTLAALRHAEAHGEGQFVDIAQVDSVVALSESAVVDYTVEGTIARPSGNAHPWVRPYELFPCADGFVFFGGYTDRLWRASCTLFGTPEMADDPEIDSMSKRFVKETYDRRVRPLVLSWFEHRTREELEAIASEVVPLTAVRTIAEVVDDPLTTQRGMVVQTDYGSLGVLRSFGQPVMLSATPADTHRQAPRPHQHTDVVLAGMADCSAEEIEDLRRRGVVA